MYETLADGSLLFKTPIPFFTNSYYQDPLNPLHYIPKYEPCTRRRFELKTLPCGRCTGVWRCEKFQRSTSVSECEACHEREAQ
jgi:hypothetical protein